MDAASPLDAASHMDASPKMLGKVTKLLLHLVFCALESFYGSVEDKHRPSLVSVGMCQGADVPHGTSPQA